MWLYQPLLPATAALGGEVENIGSVAGTASASAFAASTGAAAGAATAAAIAASVGSSSGVATASGIASEEGSVGEAAGAASATGFSSSTGEASGAGAAAAISVSVGSSSGVATASGVADVAGVGSAAGSSTALGVAIVSASTVTQAVHLAVYDRIRAQMPTLPLYDFAPYDVAMPFGILFDQDVIDDDTIAQLGYRHTITLRIYSNYRGQKEVLALLDAAWTSLHNYKLTLDVGRHVVLRCESQQTMRDPDGLTRVGELSLVLRTSVV